VNCRHPRGCKQFQNTEKLAIMAASLDAGLPKLYVLPMYAPYSSGWIALPPLRARHNIFPPHPQQCLMLSGVWRRLSSSVTLHGGPADGFTRAGQAMTSFRLQSNYSSTATLHGGPVVLRPVRATPCFMLTYML